MKNKLFCLIVFASLFFSCASSETQEAVYRRISASEARKMMQELKEYIILDVRTEVEFAQRRIPGAVLIPHAEIRNRAEKELPDKNMVILVHCQLGRRSENAARKLVSMGYVNVYDFGGLADWPYEIDETRVERTR
ncbi:MAG: rhodanese-like domain-containing protein [Spirochaetes bacterium]|nr:rhodanese-like domain-containing protein [Spirochaetota bacterium]